MSQKGHYPGGSTIIYGPTPVVRKKPKAIGALDIWIADAVDMNVRIPEDIRLKPIQRFMKKTVATQKTTQKTTQKKRKNAIAVVKSKTGKATAVRFQKLRPESRAKMFEKFVEHMRLHTQPDGSSTLPNPQDDASNAQQHQPLPSTKPEID